MNKDGSHGHTCHCPAGKGGPVCASDTTASFNQTSQLAIVSAAPESSGAPYELSLSLRTTLPNCTSVVSGVDVLGRVVFAIDLREGLPAIQVMGVDERMQPNLKGETLNDGEYWKIAVMSQNATVKMLVWDAAMNKIAEATWPLPGTWRVFTTKFGGGSGDDQHQSAFTGCIRDVIINGKHVIPAEHAATSLNVALGCPRLTQCTNDTCSGNGKCVDLWDHYSCDCKRPFLPPQCAESLVESTFGRENVRSYAR
uniref:EGF-like domain-containing protein n=1 Tax=Plectus sambesii TaxID=2011161 RepID=A0A914VEG2_9BILA